MSACTKLHTMKWLSVPPLILLEPSYAKVVEFRRHMEYFRRSGKTLVAYLDSAAEKEYLLALGCDEIYMPPGGSLRLNGFANAASFVREAFDNLGIEPNVVRIGDYKSAGDTINRRNSTEAFREVQWTLLQQTSDFWLGQVALDTGKAEEEVRQLREHPITDPMRLAYRKFITASLYLDQVKDLTTIRHGKKRFPWAARQPAKFMSMRDFLKSVGRGRKYLPGVPGTRGPRVAVINAAGTIGSTGDITTAQLNGLLDRVERDSFVKAVILRIDSPGGDALTSELIWRRILKLRARKPVVASMLDVAASGGYFLSMPCNAIVAEETTITGSIGVVAILFKLKKLFEKVGLNEEQFALGKFAKLFLPGHSLSEDEKTYFESEVQLAYESFVQKAAFSRSMTWEQLHEVAQGRVWRGQDALKLGLCDAHGGIWRAIEIAKKLAKIPDEKSVTVSVVSGRKPLFGRSNNEELDALLSEDEVRVRMGRPLALADDVVGDYLKAIGGAIPGQQAWTEGLGTGLLGTMAMQEQLKPVIEDLLEAQIARYLAKKQP